MQIGFMDFYAGVLGLRTERADLLANNIANADTPGFKATDVPFEAGLAAQLSNPNGEVKPQFRAAATVSLDGNDVSVDSERIEAAQNGEQMMGAASFLRQSTANLITALRPNPSGN